MPPERSSSNDLLLEQLRELIAERQRDLSEGISARAIHRGLEQHEARDDLRFRTTEDMVRRIRDELDERIRDLERGTVRRSDARDLATGRYNISPVAMPPVAINLEPRVRSKRPSGIPSVASVFQFVKSPAVQWIAIGLIAASHLLTRCGVMPPVIQSPTPTNTR